jgi:hypothetical protein
MNTYEAYQYQTQRLTEEQKISLNVKENNVGRKLLPCEIVEVFNLEPSEEIKPKKRKYSEEVEHWNDQL